MLKIFLGKLTESEKGVLLFLMIDKFELAQYLFAMPEIPWQYKRQIFLLELAKNASPLIYWVKENLELFKPDLQLLQIVASGSLEALAAFQEKNRNISQEEKMSALYFARAIGNVDVARHLSESLESETEAWDGPFPDRIYAIVFGFIKFGLLSSPACKSMLVNLLDLDDVNFIKKLVPYLQNHLGDLLINFATTRQLELVKLLIRLPEISDKHKAMALKQAIELSTGTDHTVIAVLLEDDGIQLGDLEEALQIAKEYEVDEIVTMLQAHLNQKKLVMMETSAVYTPAMAAANRNISASTPEHNMDIHEAQSAKQAPFKPS